MASRPRTWEVLGANFARLSDMYADEQRGFDEHDANARVGTCIASWAGIDGSLRIAARVDDEQMATKVRNGTVRGLSLGTDMVLGENGDVLYRAQKELSVCEEGKRDGTWISHINGRPVHAVACASKRAGVPLKPHNQLCSFTCGK